LQTAWEIAKQTLTLLTPRLKLSVSENADHHRVLSTEASSEPGRWRTSRTPYLKEIMDCFSDPSVEEVDFMSSTQVGKTSCLENVILYYILEAPCPILVAQPTVDMAETFSRDRIAKMLRDCPSLSDIVSIKTRDSQNTLLHKSFVGGNLNIIGANSPSSVSSRSCKVILIDEEDRMSTSGSEGDSSRLIIRRANNFPDRKIGRFSTPGNEGKSKIAEAFKRSDKRYYNVPCPHCRMPQILYWTNIKWDEDSPQHAWYECPNCKGIIRNTHKTEMLRDGVWIPTAKFTNRAGFHIWEAYSPWRTFGDIVVNFLECKDNPESFKTWVNTSLGEPYEEVTGKELDYAKLQARAEPYKILTVPKGGLILTAGVDVQHDRLALVIRAWGRDEKSWLIYYQELWGDIFTKEPWEQLDTFLDMEFDHHSGAKLKIRRMAIDSGDGNSKNEVYNYCRNNARRGVIPIKGSSTKNKPIVSRPSTQDFDYKGRSFPQSIRLYLVGSDTATATIYGRLGLEREDQRGYYHFPIGIADQYYSELTSEKFVTEIAKNGITKEYWRVLPKRRNEVLDCEKYNLAAAYTIGINLKAWDWDKEEARINKSLESE